MGQTTSFPVREMSESALDRGFAWMAVAVIGWSAIGAAKIVFFRGPRLRG